MKTFLALFLIAGCAWGQAPVVQPCGALKPCPDHRAKPEVQSPLGCRITADGTSFECDSLVAVEPGGPYLLAKYGSKVVLLTDAEYAHLQVLRQAVSDEEKRLAIKYGAQFSCPNGFADINAPTCEHWIRYGDTYTFHGQFLLIEKAK